MWEALIACGRIPGYPRGYTHINRAYYILLNNIYIYKYLVNTFEAIKRVDNFNESHGDIISL